MAMSSPWAYDSADYQGNRITLTVNFDNATRAISGAQIDRDASCVYKKIYIGIGGDGSLNSSSRVFTAGNATGHPITAAELSTAGIDTIEDLFQFQITAGP